MHRYVRKWRPRERKVKTAACVTPEFNLEPKATKKLMSWSVHSAHIYTYVNANDLMHPDLSENKQDYYDSELVCTNMRVCLG